MKVGEMMRGGGGELEEKICGGEPTVGDGSDGCGWYIFGVGGF